jgi:hypothetical protein
VVFDLIGPYGFARVIAIVFMALGTVLLIRQIRALRLGLSPEAVARGSEDEEGYPASARRAGAMILATFAYPILMEPLGYILTSIAYIVGGLLIYGERHLKWGIPLAIIYGFGTFWIFAILLRVPLPGGPIEQVLVALGLLDRVR